MMKFWRFHDDNNSKIDQIVNTEVTSPNKQ